MLLVGGHEVRGSSDQLTHNGSAERLPCHEATKHTCGKLPQAEGLVKHPLPPTNVVNNTAVGEKMDTVVLGVEEPDRNPADRVAGVRDACDALRNFAEPAVEAEGSWGRCGDSQHFRQGMVGFLPEVADVGTKNKGDGCPLRVSTNHDGNRTGHHVKEGVVFHYLAGSAPETGLNPSCGANTTDSLPKRGSGGVVDEGWNWENTEIAFNVQ